MALNEVTVVVSAVKSQYSVVLPGLKLQFSKKLLGPVRVVPEGRMIVNLPMTYDHAIAFRNRDRNCDGMMELYRVPVYQVHILGKGTERHTWNALRFMRAWIDDGKYRGFAMAAPKARPRTKVTEYKRAYLNNTGAIVIEGWYYIHRGPKALNDGGWNGRGCVEIVGNFRQFLGSILSMSRIKQTADIHADMLSLIRAGKLFVKVDAAKKPPLVVDRQVAPPRRLRQNPMCPQLSLPRR